MASWGRLVGLLVVLLPAMACGGSRTPAGDAARGRQAFVDLRCNACHEVSGEALPPPDVVPAVALGGRRLLPPSEEALRADILLPSSHFAVGYPTEQITKDGRSRMPDYSKVLTETQVADLVAFLRAHYQRGLPSATR
jgi:mono/diheme cytochrome c family protein